MPVPAASAVLALHFAVALFGFAGLFGKWLALPPTVIVLGRTLVAAVALAIVALAQRTPLAPARALAGNGVVLAIHWIAFFEAVQVASVAIGLLGYASFPLFVLAFERVMLGRHWTASEAATAMLVVVGLVILVPSFDPDDATLRGLAWGVLSGATFALLAVWNRRYVATHAPLAVALWQNAFAAIVLLPFVWIGREAIPALSARDVALLAVLGIVCTALAHTLFVSSLRRLSAHTASVVAALEPVYGIALAVLLLGEVPTLRTLVGAALIVGAAIHATRIHSSSRTK
jgi:drug/metabolite transporter (DMT)-like permease